LAEEAYGVGGTRPLLLLFWLSSPKGICLSRRGHCRRAGSEKQI
jgi:hypothetical protein